MKRIKVAHIITRQDKGGSAENTFLTVLKLNKEKFDVTLIKGATLESDMSTEEQKSNKEDLERIKKSDVKIITINKLVRRLNPLNDLKTFIKLFFIIRKEQYYIVHTHTSKAGILGRWAAYLARTPLIIHTPHGHVFQGYYGEFMTLIFKILERITALITDKIITLTEREKQEHINYKISMAEKFITIHSGVEIGKFLNVSFETVKKLKESFNIPEGALVVGTIGRLVPVKGHKYFIQSAYEILKSVKNIRFLITGDGPLAEELKETARQLNISEFVIFTGWTKNIAAIISILDIFVLPSLNEGMGKVLVEAMLLSKPIVASNVGGIMDLVNDEENGILVPPASSSNLARGILQLIESENKRKQMGSCGRLISENYGDKVMVEKIEKLYEDLLKQHTTR